MKVLLAFGLVAGGVVLLLAGGALVVLYLVSLQDRAEAEMFEDGE